MLANIFTAQRPLTAFKRRQFSWSLCLSVCPSHYVKTADGIELFRIEKGCLSLSYVCYFEAKASVSGARKKLGDRVID